MGPVIGLPVLPVVEFGGSLTAVPGRPFTWKFGPVARFAAGRPLAWLDDDFDAYPAARDAFLDRRRADGLSTELIRVNPPHRDRRRAPGRGRGVDALAVTEGPGLSAPRRPRWRRLPGPGRPC